MRVSKQRLLLTPLLVLALALAIRSLLLWIEQPAARPGGALLGIGLMLGTSSCLAALVFCWQRPGLALRLRLLFSVFVFSSGVFLVFCQPFRPDAANWWPGLSAGAWAASIMIVETGVGSRWGRAFRITEFVLFQVCLTSTMMELGLRSWSAASGSPWLERGNALAEERVHRFRFKPGELRFGFPVDSRGYYDEAYSPETRGELLVTSIGDSFSASIVPHDYHYTTVGERLLPGSQIYNIGIETIGPREYLWLLGHEALPMEPDAVLIALYIGNDLQQSIPIHVDRPLFREWLDSDYMLSYLFPRRLLRVTRERALVGGDIGMRLGEEMALSYPWNDYREEQPTVSRAAYVDIERAGMLGILGDEVVQFDGLFDLLREMKELCGETPMLVQMIPAACQVDDGLWSEVSDGFPDLDRDRPQRLLRTWLQQEGIPVLDLLPALLAVPPEPDGARHLFHRNDTHINARGNEVIGKALAGFLSEQFPSLRDLENLVPTELSAESGQVEFHNPMLPLQLTVRATAGDRQTDVTKAQHGTLYETSAPLVVSVSPDGELLAHQTGEAVIRVRHRDLETTVRVSARWDSPLVVQEPLPDSTGRTPHMELGLERFRPGGFLSIQVTEAPPETTGRLILVLRPADPSRLAPPQQNFVAPVQIDAAGNGSLEFPVPESVPPGLWAYVQVFFGESPTSPDWCSTDGHIVTVR